MRPGDSRSRLKTIPSVRACQKPRFPQAHREIHRGCSGGREAAPPQSTAPRRSIIAAVQAVAGARVPEPVAAEGLPRGAVPRRLCGATALLRANEARTPQAVLPAPAPVQLVLESPTTSMTSVAPQRAPPFAGPRERHRVGYSAAVRTVPVATRSMTRAAPRWATAVRPGWADCWPESFPATAGSRRPAVASPLRCCRGRAQWPATPLSAPDWVASACPRCPG